jgi:hypothetical protein
MNNHIQKKNISFPVREKQCFFVHKMDDIHFLVPKTLISITKFIIIIKEG